MTYEQFLASPAEQVEALGAFLQQAIDEGVIRRPTHRVTAPGIFEPIEGEPCKVHFSMLMAEGYVLSGDLDVEGVAA